MKYSLLDVAFSGLMHDIGKFYQRTDIFSDLTDAEKDLTPIANAGYHTHLHSGYTSKFFRKYLKRFDGFERITSSHHLPNTDEFSRILKDADCIASAIDRKDEDNDTEEKNKTGAFQVVRLSSVMSEIDFGEERHNAKFKLDSFSSGEYPLANYQIKSKEDSVDEYKTLWNKFINDLKDSEEELFKEDITKYNFDHLYSLLYEYATYIPASTFEGNQTFVSLFDHLKLTSAIASCLYLNEPNNNDFVMLEFDVSGIQKFIFKVTEGKDTKRGISKSLRGRSFLISAITNCITYSYLHEFGLTQSNIIFNTGGGALLLLPKCDGYKERIEKVSDVIQASLLEMFHTDINYVYSFVECDADELEQFKIDKAISLKAMLEEEKLRKFHNRIDDKFFYQLPDNASICVMCGSNFVKRDGDRCKVCDSITELSDFFVKHEKMFLLYDFTGEYKEILHNCVCIDMHYMQMYLIDSKDVSLYKQVIKHGYDYIESINHSCLGNTRWIANLAPQKNRNILPFEDIAENLLTKEEYGDLKLGILKMDVDNLGAIFAFGLSKTRSLSKYLTLSRLMETFFGYHLIHICEKVSEELISNIKENTDNDNMFYINYAGGDDLVIIGPASGILLLAKEIDHSFHQYTNNKNLNISGGITIMSPSKPIRLGIKEAEENLSASKKVKGKHAITLLDRTIKLERYENVLEIVNVFKEYIDKKYISRTCFYNMMSILDVNNIDEYYHSIPLLMYSLKRNVVNEHIRCELKKEIATKNTIEEVYELVVEMKLAIMQTRES